MVEYTNNAIAYTWDLAGSSGASFTLFPDPTRTPEDIKEAKSWLRDNHDVVSLRIADDQDRDDLFKSAYFRDERCRPLKWYQIFQDAKVIRRERKKGTTPRDFVTQFVLPAIEQTEAEMLKKHGSGIYEY